MPIRNSTPVQLLPSGLTDAIDQSSGFPGSCQIMSNLVFDRNNRGAVIARPGVTTVTSFPGFNNPGVVSVMYEAGTLIYGMLKTDRNPGFDEPFCYDTVAQAFITVSGVTGGNVPLTQPTTGEWVPPTADAMGIYIIVTHPGFTGANVFGWFDVTNIAAPVWHAGNTTVNLLPVATNPQWVAQFFGRAYFGVGNAVYFTDSLALSISNTNFAAVLIIDDKSPTTGVGGLPMGQTSGAVLQSLVVFKQNSIWQISGDISLNTLSLNRIADNIGCVSPRTIQSTVLGILFIAVDGPRMINPAGTVLYLQMREGITPDIVAPFATATSPTRMIGVYVNGMYRVCLDGSLDTWDSSFTNQDYWYDLIFKRWTGPHTFDYHCGVGVKNDFYIASNINPGKIFKSSVVPSSTTVYQELGNDVTCELVSCAVEGSPMAMSSVVESTIELGGAGLGTVYYISMYDDQNNNLSPATIKLYDINPLWGTNRWAQFHWRSSVPNSQVFTIPWVNPVVFKKVVLAVRVVSAANVSIKASVFRVQTLGYTNT